MAVFVVSYHFRQPERDYAPFFERLKKYVHVQALETVWLIDSLGNSARIRDDLFEAMDPEDGLVVALLEGMASWNRLEGDADLWLLQRFTGTMAGAAPRIGPPA
jgi:hypothetical protein